MKRAIILLLCVFVATLAWRIGGRLSPDALGMGIGVVFGVLASVPAALLVLAATRRSDDGEDEYYEPTPRRRRQPQALPPDGQPPQIIVVAPPVMPMQQAGGQPFYGQMQPGAQGNFPALPGPAGYAMPPERQFHVVGEQEELIEDW